MSENQITVTANMGREPGHCVTTVSLKTDHCHSKHGERTGSLCHHCVTENRSLSQEPGHCVTTVSLKTDHCHRKHGERTGSLCHHCVTENRSLPQQTWGENRVMASSLCHRKHAGENQIIMSSVSEKIQNQVTTSSLCHRTQGQGTRSLCHLCIKETWGENQAT